MISVGIDVSKGKSTVCILKPEGEIISKPYDVTHTKKQLEILVKKIQSLTEETKVVMEATGIYYLPIARFLMERNIFVSVVNPLVMKKYAAVNLRKAKTDKLDAAKISNYGIEKWFSLEPYEETGSDYAELRMLGRKYSSLMKRYVQNKLALSNMLEQTMPGIKKLLEHRRTETGKDKLADFAYRYWHYDSITKMNEKGFIENYNRWCKRMGYHPSATKAKTIYAMAKDGIPILSSSTSSTKMLVQESVGALKETSKTLVKILRHMHTIAKGLKEYDTVMSMKGVGEILSVKLIAEIGDVRRFHSKKALIAYAGIDSPPYESGSFVGSRRKITKRGSALLRKTGYEVMLSLKAMKPEEDAAVYEYMLRKESEGKSKKLAKIAALNKFLRIYYARVMEVHRH